MGHKKIGLCLIELMIYSMEERYKGYIEGCEFFGATYKDEWIVTSTRDEEKNIN